MKFTSKSVFLMLAALVVGLVAGCGGGNDTPPVNTTFGVTTASLPAATVGTAYNQTLAASNGTTPYTWAVTTGTLPAGLALSAAGVISGTPTTAATSNFTVTVTDAATPTAKTATKALSIIVNPVPTLAITTTSPLAPGTVGTAYSQTLAASNGTLPLSWAVTTGTLPAGLTLTSAGVISGTPTAAGTSNFTVTVTDATIPTAKTATQAFSIIVAAAGTPLSISTTSPLAAGTVGSAYGPVTLVAAGGTTPHTWAVTVGALPAGLTLSSAGVISGAPTAAATSNFTVTVTDATIPTAKTATKALSITVSGTAPALTTLTPSCASACHLLPPTTVTGVAGLTSNMPHTANTKCGVCHVIGGWVAGTTTFDMAGVLTHNNGTTNILAGLPTASCTNTCHAGTGNGLPPVLAAHPTVAARAYVVNCGICHPVGSGNPFSMSGVLTHDNGTINFNP